MHSGWIPEREVLSLLRPIWPSRFQVLISDGDWAGPLNINSL